MKPYKPHYPIKGMVEDYRCFQKNLDYQPPEMGDEEAGYEECSEYDDLRSITLLELSKAYKDYDLKDIKIKSIVTFDDYSSLIIYRPETDEEFSTRIKNYELELSTYNKWVEEHTPEKKKAAKAAKLQAKFEKVQEEARRLAEMLNK